MTIQFLRRKGEEMRNEEMTNTTIINTAQSVFVKKIGKTTYRVTAHFSTTSNETMNDKIKRMLCNEVNQK